MAPVAELSSKQRVELERLARVSLKRAREHKRAAEHHRRQTRVNMDRFNEFKRRLEAMGIKVIIEPATEPQRRQSDTSSQQDGRA